MSSPESSHSAAPAGRNLTIILVPHGELETRTFMISYLTLKVTFVAVVVLFVVMILVVATYIPLAQRAARVGGLEKEVARLETENARVVELERTVQQVEEQYERVRQMLGADANVGSETVPVLPPLRSDSNRRTPPRDDDDESLVSLWPLATAGFITRTLADGRSEHPGLDIAVARNSDILAAGSGTVIAAGVDDIYGRYVVLDHGQKLSTLYGHASRLFVTAGDRVHRGDRIGQTGSTGRSTAPHLHFEVRLDGKPVDPLTYVRKP